MALSHFLTLALAAATANDTPRTPMIVEVTKGGALSWEPAPCDVEARRAGAVVGDGDATGLDVTPGPALFVISCAAKEGTITRTLSAEVRQQEKPQTITVTIAPATLVAVLTQGGTKTAGDVVVYDRDDVEVARGKDKASLLVDANAGPLRVQGRLDRGGGRLVQGESTTTVKAGAKAEVTVEIGDGELAVNVTENGRPAKAVIALWAPGATQSHVELVAGEVTSVPSGTWELRTQLQESHDFKEVVTRGVVVSPGKKSQRTINHSTQTVKLGASVPGATLEPDAVLIELFFAGAETPFNQVDPGTAARLSSGRYVARATHKTRTLDDGTHPTVEQAFSVPGPSAITLTPAVAVVDVSVKVGGKARALPVAFYVDDAAVAFAERPASADGAVSLSVSPQRLRVTSTLAAGNGPLVVERTLDVRAGKNAVPLALDKGGAVVLVMDAGAAATATVAFTRAQPKGARAPQTPPEPVVVQAGQEAWLDPGMYDVVIERRGERRPGAPIRVERGALSEASHEWSPPAAPPPPPKADAPKADGSKADGPKADAPKADAPKAGAPKADAPKADAPDADAPKADAPKDAKKRDDAKKDDAKKDDAKKNDAKKDETKKPG